MSTKYCRYSGKVILWDEISAKLALAVRQRKDTGEKRYYPCHGHFHLTSEELRNAA